MPIIHAHRGASAYAPENTLPAFRLALEQKADGIETDIHLTRDGRFVVCHDDEIARTSNGQGKIQDMTVEQLKAYDFGGKFSPVFAGTPLPTLEELLEVVKDVDPINIEIKGPFREGTDMEAAYRLLFETLQRFGCVERTLFSSFGHGWLRDLKAQYPVCAPDCCTAAIPRPRRKRWSWFAPTTPMRSTPICTASTRRSSIPAWRTASMSTSGRWIRRRTSRWRYPMG